MMFACLVPFRVDFQSGGTPQIEPQLVTHVLDCVLNIRIAIVWSFGCLEPRDASVVKKFKGEGVVVDRFRLQLCLSNVFFDYPFD